jgi:hypothetical protein
VQFEKIGKNTTHTTKDVISQEVEQTALGEFPKKAIEFLGIAGLVPHVFSPRILQTSTPYFYSSLKHKSPNLSINLWFCAGKPAAELADPP